MKSDGDTEVDGSACGDDMLLEDSVALNLLGAHIQAALIDLENPQKIIAAYFNDIVCKLDAVLSELTELPENEGKCSAVVNQLSSLKAEASQSILEFQAFDRVEQRLRNIQCGLQLVADNRNSPQQKQLELIKSTYSMEHEQTLHKLIEQGLSKGKLLEFCDDRIGKQAGDNMELY